MEVDPEFMKYLERVRALPEAKKKEIRDHLLAEAGIKPPEDKKSDQSCGDNLNREALDAAAREWTPVSPTYNPETCWHPPNQPCMICRVCGECQEDWRDETYEVCSNCCDRACWYCGSTEDVKYRLCGACSLGYDLDGICAVCHQGKVELNESGVCWECSAGVKSSKRVATPQHADKQERQPTMTKSDWLSAEECPAMAWRELRAAPTPPDEAGRFRMEQGQDVGSLARKLYPNGILVSKTDGRTTAEVTQDLIADGAIETLFEAAFRAGPFVAKADILRRQNGAWHVLEVKSSFSDTKKTEDLVDDLAYTVMVLQRSGLPVAQASLLLLSRTYRFGDSPDHLFDVIDKTAEAHARVADFERAADSLAQALFADAPPTPALVSACRSCSFFASECLGAGLAHTVLELPSLHHTKLKRLSAEGIIDLSLVPADLKLNDRQERAKMRSSFRQYCCRSWPERRPGCGRMALPLLGFRDGCHSSPAL